MSYRKTLVQTIQYPVILDGLMNEPFRIKGVILDGLMNEPFRSGI